MRVLNKYLLHSLSLFLFFQTESFTDLELAASVRLPAILRIPLSLPSQTRITDTSPHLTFYMGAGDSNMGPCASVTSILLMNHLPTLLVLFG